MAKAKFLASIVLLDGAVQGVTFQEIATADLPAITEADLTLSDITTANVTSALHGFAPKSPGDATKFLNGAATPAWAAVKDSDLSTSDITTNNASNAKHGFAPKAPGDATKFLNGANAPAFAAVKDTDLSVSDNTTNDVSGAAHGFVPKAPTDASKFLNGVGAWATPGGAGGVVIGDPVTGGMPTLILYVDGSGDVGQADALTFDDATKTLRVNDTIASNFDIHLGGTASGYAIRCSAYTFTTDLAASGQGAIRSTDAASHDARLATGAEAGYFTDTVRTVKLANNGGLGVQVTDAVFTVNLAENSGGGTRAGHFTDGTRTVDLVSTTEAASFTDGTRTVKIADGTNHVSYTATTNTDWAASTPPTDVWVALDRIAAALTALATPP